MGLMFEAAKAQDETYVGLAGAAAGPVVLLRLAVLARKPLYAFCDRFARLHARSFAERVEQETSYLGSSLEQLSFALTHQRICAFFPFS